ncbi:MAG: alpha/beta hydrolase [Candidatus Nanopelagicales bacterium]
MRHKVGLLAVTAIGALAVGLGLANRQVKRRYGRPPRRSLTTSAVPADAVDVAIVAVNGATLRGWLREAPTVTSGDVREASAAALVVHGWGGSSTEMLPVSEPLLDAGLHVLLLDARGHGRSDDADFTSMPTFAEDIGAAMAWLRTQPQVDPARIVLVGHSVGAGACLFAAAGDPDIAAVVSLASMADPASFMSRRLRQRLPDPLTALALRYVEHTIGHRFAEFAPVHTIGQIRAPVLLLHGERDTTIPLSDAYRLHAQAPDHSTLVVMPDADHDSIEALEGVTPAVLNFLHSARVTGATR